ncbi:hypothetical protein QSV34_10680 [Porticoccus sp. W117]|uniref:hypothetical protein n=1 Tax=Porticoccus sp. W117 TaxID=3054777 RepID=UPI0025925CFC|nr:hypothetical protein [Porticoccus sp. W117]MDM3871816.1 hypothetical protein [Porticoccus sp. W117]
MNKGLPYNGWSELVRHGRDNHYYHAQKRKILPQKPTCIGCQVDLPPDRIPYHSEEYGPTLEDYWASCVPMCHRCHAMLHVRFITPNLWKLYLYQMTNRAIDDSVFPLSNGIAPMLKRFKCREDIGYVPMPQNAPEYLTGLPDHEYSGKPKVATLLVIDHATGNKTEVPDWTLYGDQLELLTQKEKSQLSSSGIDIDSFLTGRIKITINSSGKRRYKRLYV